MSWKNAKKDAGNEKRSKINRLLIIEGAAIAVGIVVLVLWLSGIFSNGAFAVSINGHEFSKGEFRHYYESYYNAYCEDNSQFISYMFDTSKSLKEQTYEEGGKSWFDFFVDETIEMMKEIVILSDEAETVGYKLSESEEAAVREPIALLDEYAAEQGVTVDSYLKERYGEGMTSDKYEKIVRMTALAKSFKEFKTNEATPSDEELRKYYDDNSKEYITVAYERFYVKACDPKSEPTDEQKTAAKKIADTIYDKVQNGETLKEAATPYADKGAYFEFEDATYSPSFSYGDWLFSEERKDGDCEVIDDGSGYYVMVFHSRNENENDAAVVYDIFFPAAEGDSVDEMLENSCTDAEKALAAWESGDATAESFEKMAKEKSLETGAIYYYPDLISGMVDGNITKWCLDTERKPGDTQVIYTSDGFHLVYYLKSGDKAWKVLALKDFRQAQYDRWYEEKRNSATCIRNDAVINNIEK